jgi:molybdopterin molybdotransferase
MLSIAQALQAIMDAISPLGPERVELGAALGRVLFESLVAREDAPPFDASAMDGYAVRASDLGAASEAAPVTLPVLGESRAGGPWPPPLARGSAARIFTGAPMPEGADAVVIQEHVEREGARARFRTAPAPGANVRTRGEECRAGDPLLPRGAILGPGEIALAASQGFAALVVHRAPSVAILTNGDELRDPDEPARPGSIVDSNAPAIAAAVREAGGVPLVLPRAPDRLDVLTARIREGLRADALVLCGGVSVGEHDRVHRALESAGVATRFWKVSIKPGKPLVFGLAGTTPVFGLPGNPVSAWVTFEVFVRPALRRMQGDPRPFRHAVQARLAAAHRHAKGRTELARARLSWEGDHAIAHLHPLQGSGAIVSIANVDALVVLPADRDHFEAGEQLYAIPLALPRAFASPFG